MALSLQLLNYQEQLQEVPELPGEVQGATHDISVSDTVLLNRISVTQCRYSSPYCLKKMINFFLNNYIFI